MREALEVRIRKQHRLISFCTIWPIDGYGGGTKEEGREGGRERGEDIRGVHRDYAQIFKKLP
jgi:hypothetical protein